MQLFEYVQIDGASGQQMNVTLRDRAEYRGGW